MAISSAVDASAVARVVGIETNFRNLRNQAVVFLPQRVAIIGQGNSTATYTTDKRVVTSALEVGQTYGFGSPVHLAALEVLPVDGRGVGTIPVTIYPVQDDAGGVAATATITPTGTATAAGSFRIRVNGILSNVISVDVGDDPEAVVDAIVPAINDVLNMPIVATDGTTVANVAAKWDGSSGNALDMELVGTAPAGVTMSLSNFASGANNPDISAALSLIGNVWETMVIPCMEVGDTTALNDLQTVNEGRWAPLVRRPFNAIFGNNEISVANAIAIPDARPTDRTSVVINAPGCKNLPWVIAAAAVAQIAPRANNNPAYDYGSLTLPTLLPGTDGEQFEYNERDLSVKGGAGTTTLRDNVITLEDVVTFYHPTGDVTPAYRYLVDIVKVQQILFNLDLIFVSPSWDGAPLVPDNQPVVNPAARSPKNAIAAVAGLIDSLGEQAIISDPATAKTRTQAGINSQNPKRLDIALTVQLSGNVNIISIDFNFGFFFGGAN